MAVHLNEKKEGTLLEVQASGKLGHDDYVHFAPEVERLVKEHGKIDILFEMTDFHGWKARAAWDDLKFGIKHYSDLKRLAVVGDKRWERAMCVVCRPFSKAKIRYFDRKAIDEARSWLGGN